MHFASKGAVHLGYISIIILKDCDLLSAILYTAIQIKVGRLVSRLVNQSPENSELFLKFYGNFLKAFWVDL